MPYIRRHLESVIQTKSKSPAAVLVSGPRHAGKTTMLQTLMTEENAGRTYVSLDDFRNRLLAKADPGSFLQYFPPPVLIDEVQHAPELFPYIKSHIDRHRNPGDFWLTSSQSASAIPGIQESLARRQTVLHLPPLSQREIAGASCSPFTTDFNHLMAEQKRISPASSSDLFARIWRGSMPRALCSDPAQHDSFYSAYLTSLIERDVHLLDGAADSLQFSRFLVAAAARCAQPISCRALAADAGISVTTAKHWVEILEALGIIFCLDPYSITVPNQGNHNPTIYFADTGLVCYLARLPTPETAEACMCTALVKNFAISEIVKGYHGAGRSPSLYSYRGKGENGIHAVLSDKDTLYPLAISASCLLDSRLADDFRALDRGSLQRGTGAILCLADSLSAIDRSRLIVPIWML